MRKRRSVPPERFAVVVLAVTFLGSVAFARVRRALAVSGLTWTVLQITVTVAVMLVALRLLQRRGSRGTRARQHKLV